MPSNREATIEEIKDRLDIVDVIGSVVQLKKAGANYKGLCPFHNEKTPSFMVSPNKQIYTCFGCDEKGDVISFVEKYYNMDFVQAAEKLADSVGLTLKRNARSKEQGKDEYFEINRQAAIFFYKALRTVNNPGAAYMSNRGISADTMKKFGIGWADEDWSSLYEHLKRQGYSDEKIIALGLASRAENGRIYDKFRGRVIFPIMNTSGKVIGFGGRALGDAMPKYLNSQESDVFKKKYNLYAINVTRSDISNRDQAILVEGYMDVISLYQAGVTNVAASLGTALTENQVRMLKRYTQNVSLSYDADEAGIKATLRGMDILKKEGLNVKIVTYQGAKDPDEFIKKRGREAYTERVRGASTFADYKIDISRQKYDMRNIEGRLGFLREAVDILGTLSPVEAEMYIKKIAKENDISEGAIRAEMRKEDTDAKNEHVKSDVRPEKLNNDERKMIKAILADSKYIEKEKDFIELFDSEAGEGILESIKNIYVPGQEIDISQLEDSLNQSDALMIEDILADEMLATDSAALYQSCADKALRIKYRKRESELLTMISMAENIDGRDKIKDMMEELQEIQKKLSVRGQ